MALASQMSRGQRVPSSSVAAYRSKRRARMLKGLGIAALVVLCGAGLLYILHGRDSGPRSANAQPVNDPLKPADAAAAAPAAPPAAANSKPPEPRPEPALISMNSTRDGARAPTTGQSPPRTGDGLTASPGSGVVRDPLVTNPAASGAPDRMDLPEDLAALVSGAKRAQREGKLADARAALNRVLLDRRTPEIERALRSGSATERDARLLADRRRGRPARPVLHRRRRRQSAGHQPQTRPDHRVHAHRG